MSKPGTDDRFDRGSSRAKAALRTRSAETYWGRLHRWRRRHHRTIVRVGAGLAGLVLLAASVFLFQLAQDVLDPCASEPIRLSVVDDSSAPSSDGPERVCQQAPWLLRWAQLAVAVPVIALAAVGGVLLVTYAATNRRPRPLGAVAVAVVTLGLIWVVLFDLGVLWVHLS